ncbi:MAG TPA: hypothetical protein PLY34_02355 [Ferruginibacter sp.]|nr:hypothetical protein [Ferruginibacter sp.]HPH90292.1 hypothetical protein [Ferruginibacter sp.]
MSLGDLKYAVLCNLKNIPGPVVKRKIVVIESDDYGGIRMPSLDALKQMKAAGIPIASSRYNLLDTLEDKDDLNAMFETLQSVQGADGNPAVMSPFVNVANPDFEKIKASGYKEYFYEPFPVTLQKYGHSDDIMSYWKQGIEAGIFTPEFHGREHVSVQPWLEKLQEGDPHLQFAAGYGFVAVAKIKGLPSYAQEFRPEFYFDNEKQKAFLHHSITEGVKLFEYLFGYTPSAFVPSNSVFHPDFEPTVFQAGIPFLCVSHKNPTPGVAGELTFTNYTFRQKIKKGQLNYYIRNCVFEPNDEGYRSVNRTLQQVDAAFRWNKPAIISTHRVNFAGGLNKSNRDKGLKELQVLLKAIVKRWPDAVFSSTAKMLKELKN